MITVHVFWLHCNQTRWNARNSYYTKCVEITQKKTIQPSWANFKVIALIDAKKFNQPKENLNMIYMKDNIEGLHVLHVLFMSLWKVKFIYVHKNTNRSINMDLIIWKFIPNINIVYKNMIAWLKIIIIKIIMLIFKNKFTLPNVQVGLVNVLILL